jgi:hypothetical protein
MDFLPIVILENVRLSVLMVMRIYMREDVLGRVRLLGLGTIMELQRFALEDAPLIITLKIGFVLLLALLHIMPTILPTNVS